MGWFLNCITYDFFNFRDRASRAEYWWFTVWSFLTACALGIVSIMLDFKISDGMLKVISAIWAIPELAVTVRRLHDSSKSGWWVLLLFIPPLGIMIFIFMLLDSTPATNKYGPNPKGDW